MMAGPGGREVGRVSVRVLPDTSSFGRSLERYLERMEHSLRLNIPVSLDQGDVDKTAAEIDILTRDRHMNVNVDFDRSEIDRLSKSLGGISGGLGKGLGGAGGGASTKMLGVVAAIAALVPIVSGLIASLPGILAGIAAPLGAVLVGIDGIKKAGQTLVAPFQRLKRAISDVFEGALTPSMQRLTRVFVPLQNGLTSIAAALSNMFANIVAQVTSPRGLRQIQRILNNIALAFSELAPSMRPLIDSLLTLAVEGTKAFAKFAPQIGKAIESFDKMIRKMQKSGELAAAFQALGILIIALVRGFGLLIGAGLRTLAMWAFFAHTAKSATLGAARAVSAMVSAVVRDFKRIGSFIRSVTQGDWGRVRAVVNVVTGSVSRLVSRMRTAVVATFRAMGARVVDIARGIPGRVVGAMQSLVSRVAGVVSRAMGRMVAGIQAGAGRAAGAARSIPGRVVGALGGLAGRLFAAGEAAVNSLARGMIARLGAVASAAASVAGAIARHFHGSPVKEGPLLSWNNGGAGKRLVESLVDGMTASIPSVTTAAGRLAAAVDSPVTAAGRHNRRGIAGGGSTYNVYETLNARATAKEIARIEAFASA